MINRIVEYIWPCENCVSAVVDVNNPEPYLCVAKNYHSGTVAGLFNGGCPYDNQIKIKEILE